MLANKKGFAMTTETLFPRIIWLADHAYTFHIWDGQRLPDRLLAYDTETALIEDRNIPQLAVATVYGSDGSGYLIHPDRLGAFITKHAGASYCCHNAVFDFWATAQHLADDPQSLAVWWAIAGEARLACTMLLDELIQLGRIDADPRHRGLDVVAQEYCGLALDKQDPYRLRYGELIGLDVETWSIAEAGFFTYACKDPVVTLQVMRAQAKIAKQLIAPYAAELLPEAERRYGPLTVCLQTQGAIALDYVSRCGIAVDVPRAHELHEEIAGLVKQHMAEMEQLTAGVEIFKRYKRTGQYQLTKSGAAKRNALAIKTQLEQAARSAEVPVRLPRVKNGTVSDAASFWAEHTELDPFIAAYVSFYQRANLLKFCHELKQPRIYPRYRVLVRTGRTSCSDPNLQQLPRDGRFREMIVAPAGYQLLQVDYAALELRTLAAVCLQRYGRSRLAELFRDGVDPHKYTAALLLSMTPEQFEQLPQADQKQHRQKAKAVNFGVPGGLGAAALVAYAKQSYGVQLTFEEAQRLRDRLTTKVYPELTAYLADQPWSDLVGNLQCTALQARQVFAQERQFRDAFRIIAGELVTLKGSPYTPELIAHVWVTLQQLNQNNQLREALQAQQPSLELARRVFWGSAVTLTGRLRGHVGYTQRANSPFQALAADGNKAALFRLLCAGFQVCGFIHDEMLILLPDGADYDAAVARVQQILADAMQELTPGVPIATEFLLADRWYKSVDEQPRDATGRIVPYTAALAEQSALQSEIDAIWKDA